MTPAAGIADGLGENAIGVLPLLPVNECSWCVKESSARHLRYARRR